MQKWEYRKTQLLDRVPNTLEDKLNEYGRDGWTLVHLRWIDGDASCACIFKRPLPRETVQGVDVLKEQS